MAEIYVYRSVKSDGARELANALGGRRVMEAPVVGPRDFLVCWGTPAGYGRNPRQILNDVPIQNKYEDALKLKRAGVPTIEVALQRPRQGEAPRVERNVALGNLRNLFQSAMDHAQDFVENDDPDFGSAVYKRGVEDFKNAVSRFADALRGNIREVAVQALPAPVVDNAEWLGRRFYHIGGKDLLGLNRKPAQYYVRKEDIVEEYRVHSFRGKSIRAGKKVHRDNYNGRVHPWIRSWDGGWKMAYEGVKGTPELRNLAHSAVAGLGLDFGAVDIGKLRDGRLIVLEVNRAPGIEGGTVEAYKKAVERWMRGE